MVVISLFYGGHYIVSPWLQTVYQKNGNLFFRTTAQKATASEQSKRTFHVHSRLIFQCSPCNSNIIAFVYLICEYCTEQLDSAKAKLEGWILLDFTYCFETGPLPCWWKSIRQCWHLWLQIAGCSSFKSHSRAAKCLWTLGICRWEVLLVVVSYNC